MNAFTISRMLPLERLVNLTKKQAEATYREGRRHCVRIMRGRMANGKWFAMRTDGQRARIITQE